MKNIVSKQFLLPFVLIASLFFFWGFAHSILDILNKHYQDALVISKTRSALVQAMVYGGYFIMAIPAGAIIRKWGYRAGVLTGLILYGIGALLFIPGEMIMSFNFFLVCLFVIGCGLTCLETASNPYIAVLGDEETSASRLNLAQSLNGLGWIVGPLVGGLLVFRGADGNSGSVALPYTIIGIAVLLIAIVISRVKLPEIKEDTVDITSGESLFHSRTFVFGLVAIFFYVAAQTGINSFFINYVTESQPSVSSRDAALMLSFGGMGLFFVGRLLGSWGMSYIKAGALLLLCALGASACMLVVILGSGIIAVSALVMTYLCESIMFPTIFALALRGLDASNTKRGSSYLIMGIVGGAIAPMLMGVLGETDMAIGFIIPLVCFIVIAAFALHLIRTK
nr:sugar MFS transporter [uncultured Prevotella sp.]